MLGRQPVAGARFRSAAQPFATRPVRSAKTMSGAPKTGFHTVEDALRQEAVSKFFDDDNAVCKPTTGGVNNVVNYVETSDGKKYILRIYNNGNKSEKVQFEHAILAQLADAPLSFKVPKALPSKAGRPHELLSSGTEACVFEIIPGTLAKTTSPEEVGRATGELCTAMARVKVDFMEPPIAPYYDLFKVHHAINGDAARFYKEVETNPEFNVCRADIDYLAGEIKAMEVKLAEFKGLGLPQQMIHGDLHYDNVMVVEDNVSGLLDFEFCAYDWRAMELAVALSKYVGEADPLSLTKRFVSGFAQHGELTEQEIAVIPDLVNLRIFSNVVYFTSRALAGEDSLESLTSRAGAYAKRVKWVNANKEAMVGVIRELMTQKTKVLA